MRDLFFHSYKAISSPNRASNLIKASHCTFQSDSRWDHLDKTFRQELFKKKTPTSWNKLPDRITQNDLSNVLETARKIFKSRQRGGNVDPSGIHLWLIFSPSSFSSYKTQEQIVHWGFQAASSPTESPEISKDQVTVRSESWSCPLKPGLDPFVQFSSCFSQLHQQSPALTPCHCSLLPTRKRKYSGYSCSFLPQFPLTAISNGSSY